MAYSTTGMRQFARDLTMRGLWRLPPEWRSLSDAQQDDLVYRTACELRQAQPEHSIWRSALRLARSIPYVPPPLPPIVRRHSITHVYAAKSNEHWRRNVERLVAAAGLFNGERIAAIACDASTHSLDVSSAMLREYGWRCYELPNDAELRETVSFLPLLCWVRAACGPSDAIFYSHTKGNTTADGEAGATLWRNAMYHHLLSDWSVVERSLERHLFAGCCGLRWPRSIGSPYPSRLDVGDWMLAGTFWWFRSEVLRHERWRQVPIDRYGVEAWPSVVASRDQAESLYQPWPIDSYPSPSPYDVMTYPLEDRQRFLGTDP